MYRCGNIRKLTVGTRSQTYIKKSIQEVVEYNINKRAVYGMEVTTGLDSMHTQIELNVVGHLMNANMRIGISGNQDIEMGL